MSKFILKNKAEIYYEDHGQGQPVIMLHGWTSSHEIYSEPIEKLKGKARFIIYDHRGHGGSRTTNGEEVTMETLADDLHEIIEGLSLENVILLGWSMGAGVVMNYVGRYGCQSLKQIILCDMTPKQLNDDEWKLGLYQGKYTAEDMKRSEEKDFVSLYHEFAVAAMPKLRKAPKILLKPVLKKLLANCDETVLKSLSRSMKTQDNRDIIGRITVPLTYFYAEPGSLFSPKLAEWYRANSNVPYNSVAFPKSSHMFITEHPKMFADELGKVLS